MLNQPFFYHGTIRRYVSLFGTLFNRIVVKRFDSAGTTQQIIKVPLHYAPKEKMLARVTNDPKLNRQTAITVPRMSFEITNIGYAANRKLNTVTRYVKGDKKQYTPVPYDFNISLYVLVKNAEDGTKILEQILPYFTPDWTPTVELIPEMDVTMDIPVVLKSVSVDDVYDGQFETRRSLVWTLNFVLHGYIFGPVKQPSSNGSGIIKLVNTNFYDTTDYRYPDVQPVERVTIQPGQLANGSATSNIQLTIPYANVEANSSWNYIVRIVDP